jgi:transposase InsO family protein
MFAVMSVATAQRLGVKIKEYYGPKQIIGWNLEPTGRIYGRAKVRMQLAGATRHYHVWVVSEAAGYDMILGAGWMEREDVKLEPARRKCTMRRGETTVLECKTEEFRELDPGLMVKLKAETTGKIIVGLHSGDVEIALEKLEQPMAEPQLPTWAIDLKQAFNPTINSEGHELTEHSEWDAPIDLTTENIDDLPHMRPRPMGQEELVLLKRMMDLMEQKGFIQKSISPAASPVRFAHKPGGGVRLCIDYRKLNNITVPNRTPIPLISDTIRLISGATIFTKLDISAAFHRLRIRPGDEWKTAFATRFGLFEWKVLPFGLRNAPACFQQFINFVLKDRLTKDVVVYVDDILIYSKSVDEHRKTVRWVLKQLIKYGLPADPKKSEFEVKRVDYLGMVLHAGQGIAMNPKKVKAITDYIRPTCVTGLRRFLGIAIEYRKFIPRYAEITAPLTDMLKGSPKKKSLLQWTAEAERAFEQLKTAFTTTIDNGGIMKEWETGKPCRIETDASAWAAAGQLLQEIGNTGTLAPVAYESHKWTRTERNWTTHDKELGAVMHCVDTWEPEIKHSPEIDIVTDHRTLQFFQGCEQRSEKQIRWKEVLDRFPQIKWQYRPGEQNVVADALSRKETDKPTKQEIAEERTMAIIATARQTNNQQPDKQPTNEWAMATKADAQYQRWMKDVNDKLRQWSTPRPQAISIAECRVHDGKLVYRDRIWVPNHEPLRTKILQAHHDTPTTGHPGRDSMRRAIAAQFWWPKLTEDVTRYIRNCDVCGRTKIWREKEGLLKPLPLAERPWQHISMDYATDLPMDNRGFKNVLVVVDRATKEVEFIKTKTLETEELIDVFLERIVGRHGFPESIVSDRGAQFTSTIWRTLCARAGVDLRLSTAYHPQTDGQSERAVQSMKDLIRKTISAQPASKRTEQDWSKFLPLCQLAANSRTSDTTGFAPYFLTHGTQPRIAADVMPATQAQGARPLREAAKSLHDRLRKAWDWANAAAAIAQESQEQQANRGRRAAAAYKVGDKVWLSLRHRGMEKLGPRNAKYTITRVVGSHNYELDTPAGSLNIFHADQLRPASNDPFESQQSYDPQPPPAITGDDPEDGEYEIDFISKERYRGRQPQVLVHWKGYDQPEWQPRWEFIGTTALRYWEEAHPPQGKLKEWRERQEEPDLPEIFSPDVAERLKEMEEGEDAM